MKVTVEVEATREARLGDGSAAPVVLCGSPVAGHIVLTPDGDFTAVDIVHKISSENHDLISEPTSVLAPGQYSLVHEQRIAFEMPLQQQSLALPSYEGSEHLFITHSLVVTVFRRAGDMLVEHPLMVQLPSPSEALTASEVATVSVNDCGGTVRLSNAPLPDWKLTCCCMG